MSPRLAGVIDCLLDAAVALAAEVGRGVKGAFMKPGAMIIMSGLVSVVIWVVVCGACYTHGVQEGRRQMTKEHAAEIRRANAASHPEQIREWLDIGRGQQRATHELSLSP